jgi:hypothetical protein
VIFFVSSLPNSTHVLKSTSAKLKNIGKKHTQLKKWQIFDEKALLWGEKCLRKAGSLSYLVLVDSVFPSRFFKGAFFAAVVLEPLWAESGIFEDQGAAIAERDFLGPPIWALV